MNFLVSSKMLASLSVSFSIKMARTYLDQNVITFLMAFMLTFKIILVGKDELGELCIVGELGDHLSSKSFKDLLMDCTILWLHGSNTAIVSRSTNI